MTLPNKLPHKLETKFIKDASRARKKRNNSVMTNHLPQPLGKTYYVASAFARKMTVPETLATEVNQEASRQQVRHPVADTTIKNADYTPHQQTNESEYPQINQT